MARRPPPLTAPAGTNPPTASATAGRGIGAFGFEPSDDGPLRTVAITKVRPNPRQPRMTFEDVGMQRLVDSIRTVGLMSPPIVRPVDDGYELIAGERRWRACQRLQMRTMPVLIQATESDGSALAMAVAENAAREDLNPIDEAHAFTTLTEEFGLTQQELGKRIGKSQEDISNTIRLLNLPDEIHVLLRQRELTKAHGKVLLSEPDYAKRRKLGRRAARENWSVRQLREAIGAAATARAAATPKRSLDADISAALERWNDALHQHVGPDISIRPTASGFQLTGLTDFAAARRLLLQLGIPAEQLDESRS